MGKKKKGAEAPGLIAQLQEAIRNSGKSMYQLSKESGVAGPMLSRFMSGRRTLTLPAAEKLCRTLQLDLVARQKPRSRRAPKPKEEE